MHRVLQQVEQQEPRDKADCCIANRPGGESHAQHRLQLGPERRRRGEHKCRQHDIKQPDTEIPETPAQRREFAAPPRPQQLRQRDDQQAAENDGEGYQGCLLRRPRLTLLSHHIPAGQTNGMVGASGAESFTSPSPPIA